MKNGTKTALEGNLKHLAERMTKEQERRLLLLDMWLEKCFSEQEKMPFRPLPGIKGLLHRPPVEEDCFSPLKPQLALWQKEQLAGERSALCLLLAEHIRQKDMAFSLYAPVKSTRCRLCYVPSVRTEKAYHMLLGMRPDMTVFYARNAREAVMEVDAGRADFCLLPKEDEEGITALAMERLADQFDLLPAARVRFVPDGCEGTVLFGLFGKADSCFSDLSPLKREVRLSGGEHLPLSLSALTNAACAFGFLVEESVCRSDIYGRMRATLGLGGEGDRLALELYVRLFCEECTVLVAYPLLTEDA